MSRLERLAVPLVLTAMAISRPVLDVIGQNAEFFLVRGAPQLDIVATAVLIGLGVPLVAGLLGSIPGKAGAVVWWAVTFIPAVVLARLVLDDALSDSLLVLAAVGVGAGVAWIAWRFAWARQMARYLVFVPLLFTGLFFFASPSGAVAREGATEIRAAEPTEPVPLVWIVFDEFPAASIMRPDGTIDRERFPNFARLADDGAWYPNAVTVHQQTEHAVPAMLTGLEPQSDRTPTTTDYPNNVFTLLSASHDLRVNEAITRLCPQSLCAAAEPEEPIEQRIRSLGSDVAIVSGHVLLPASWTASLPPIDQKWGYFGSEFTEYDPVTAFWEARGDDPRRPFTDAVREIEPIDTKPPFVFVHALVPHHPWILLPSGQIYPIADRTPGTTRFGWGTDPWLVDQGLQRHLLAVGYADFALGEMLDAIEDAGWYDESMIIAVADHGIAIRKGVENHRQINETTIGEIAAVPLFVKAPGVEPGTIDDRRVLTTDLVPTVADAMGIVLPWEPDGRSLLGEIGDRGNTTTVGAAGEVTYGTDGTEVLEVAGRIAASFPRTDLYALVPPGAPDILGESVDVAQLADSDLTFALRNRAWYQNVDPEGDTVPVWVSARVTGAEEPGDIVAVIVNGRAAAVTRTYTEDDGPVELQAVVPPAAFAPGMNNVEFAVWNGFELLAGQ